MAGMFTYPWYHGNLTRLQTERVLQESALNGSYLVRASENIKGAYVLSVLSDGQIYQYRILPTAAGKFQMKYANNMKGDTYSNVAELISSVSTHGLCCPLRHPVPVVKDDDIDSDEDDDDDRMGSVDSFSTSSTQEQASKLLIARLSQMDISSLDREFIEFINNYITTLMESDIQASSTKDMAQLKTMMEFLGKQLKREADHFLVKMKVMHSLFDLKKSPPKKFKLPRSEPDIKLTELMKSLANCQNEVRSVEKTAFSCFQTLSLSESSVPIESPTSSLTDRKNDSFFATSSYQPTEPAEVTDDSNSPKSFVPPPLPVYQPQQFEVRQEGRNVVEALKSNKMKLTVNVTQGFLTVIKQSAKDFKEEIVTYKQDSIAQLVKSRDYNTRLTIAFTNGKKKEYSFEHPKQREYFCQLVQSMKLCHTNSKEIDQISVFIGTFNMGDAPPPSNILSWLTCQGEGKQRDKNIPFMGYDLYVIGTQESTLSEKEWMSRLKHSIRQITPGLDKDYHVVTLSSLWGIRLTVLVKPDHQHRISNVRTSSVKTGIANALGNKGAVGVSFYFSNTSFCFINSHLTSGTEKMERRNQNYHDILKGLNLNSKGQSVFDLTNQFHHFYFLGDLNYRVEWNVQDIFHHIGKKDYDTLLKYDQLNKQKNLDAVFVGFNESEITFPPTYRYELGLRTVYAYKKVKKTKIRINEPSWCDRILWRSFPGTYNENFTYGCSKDIVTSDHSPVFASFLVGILPPATIPENTQDNQNIKIIFGEVEATLKTSMCSRTFFLEFHSTCMETKVTSKKNEECEQLTSDEVRPVWRSEQLPELVPIFPDTAYLEDQHILLALKSEDSGESYGECVLELKDKFTSNYVRFSTILTHHGQKTGLIRGQMHIKAKDESLYGSAKRIRTYELISFDDREGKIAYYASDPSPHSSPQGASTATSASPATGDPVSSHRIKAITKGMQRAFPWTRDQTISPVLPPKQKPSAKIDSTVSSSTVHVNNSHANNLSNIKEESPSPSASFLPPPLPPPRAPSPVISDKIAMFSQDEKATLYEVEDINQLSPMSRRAPIPSPGPPSLKPNLLAPAVKPRGPRKDSSGSPVKSQNSFEAESDAPPLPMKMKQPPTSPVEDQDVYDSIRIPTTISQWLMDLGLPQYIHDLVANGWDRIAFIHNISDSDLLEAGIHDPKHRRRILESIKNMASQE